MNSLTKLFLMILICLFISSCSDESDDEGGGPNGSTGAAEVKSQGAEPAPQSSKGEHQNGADNPDLPFEVLFSIEENELLVDWNPAAVSLVLTSAEGDIRALCSGSLIGKSKILTNSKCIPPDYKDGLDVFYIFFPDVAEDGKSVLGHTYRTSTKLVDKKDQRLGDDSVNVLFDYAIIEMEGEVEYPGLKVNESGVAYDSSLFIYASKLVAIESSDNKIEIGLKSSHCVAGDRSNLVPQYDTPFSSNIYFHQCDMSFDSGTYLGAPLIGTSGEVYGVFRATHDDIRLGGFATNTSCIKSLGVSIHRDCKRTTSDVDDIVDGKFDSLKLTERMIKRAEEEGGMFTNKMKNSSLGWGVTLGESKDFNTEESNHEFHAGFPYVSKIIKKPTKKIEIIFDIKPMVFNTDVVNLDGFEIEEMKEHKMKVVVLKIWLRPEVFRVKIYVEKERKTITGKIKKSWKKILTYKIRYGESLNPQTLFKLKD
ncbi:MAG: hypothetical protein HOE90_23295 [Bacteriovoracaceae bacterium]|jgi:hypothetical protein|nr:hypothetical protein [Bacteriovoracaceae bacterium]